MLDGFEGNLDDRSTAAAPAGKRSDFLVQS
jgi:hypothetical protein